MAGKTRTSGELALALDHISQDMKERDERQTQRMDAIASENREWQGEVRKEFSEVKTRLTVIETQTSTKDIDKALRESHETARATKWATWASIGLLSVSMVGMYLKLSANHAETTSTIQQTAQETLKKVETTPRHK